MAAVLDATGNIKRPGWGISCNDFMLQFETTFRSEYPELFSSLRLHNRIGLLLPVFRIVTDHLLEDKQAIRLVKALSGYLTKDQAWSELGQVYYRRLVSFSGEGSMDQLIAGDFNHVYRSALKAAKQDETPESAQKQRDLLKALQSGQ